MRTRRASSSARQEDRTEKVLEIFSLVQADIREFLAERDDQYFLGMNTKIKIKLSSHEIICLIYASTDVKELDQIILESHTFSVISSWLTDQHEIQMIQLRTCVTTVVRC